MLSCYENIDDLIPICYFSDANISSIAYLPFGSKALPTAIESTAIVILVNVMSKF
jgi:hypothetical protein